MSESNNLPQAISYKKLTYLMLNAHKDLNASDDKKILTAWKNKNLMN
jgi:hypothetical protein